MLVVAAHSRPPALFFLLSPIRFLSVPPHEACQASRALPPLFFATDQLSNVYSCALPPRHFHRASQREATHPTGGPTVHSDAFSVASAEALSRAQGSAKKLGVGVWAESAGNMFSARSVVWLAFQSTLSILCSYIMPSESSLYSETPSKKTSEAPRE